MKIKEQERTGIRLSEDEDEPDDNTGTTTTTTTNNMNNTNDNSRSSVDCIISSSSCSNRKDLRTESIASLRAKAQCYNTSRVNDRQRRTSGDSAKSDGSDVTEQFESCFEIPSADRKNKDHDVIDLDNDVI